MADGHRRAPGEGYSERSKITRKISVAFDNETFATLVGAARAEGISTAAVVRRIVAAAPSDQALRAAKAEGMREAAGIATSGIAVVCSVPSHAERVISAAILAAAEKLERGE